jgi:hypothetical protein
MTNEAAVIALNETIPENSQIAPVEMSGATVASPGLRRTAWTATELKSAGMMA